jgi:hypothetical protein
LQSKRRTAQLVAIFTRRRCHSVSIAYLISGTRTSLSLAVGSYQNNKP